MLKYDQIEISDRKKLALVTAGFLVGLLLIELTAGLYFSEKAPSIYENCYRVSENGATLEPFINHIIQEKQKGEKILVVLGGSTSYGSSSNHDETTVCHLSKLLTGVKVYNLATDANRPTDDYLIFKAINPYVDYIILNGYYGWFYFPSLGENQKEIVAHPEYTFLPGLTDADSIDMLAQPHSERKAEYFFDSIASSISRTYRNRQLMQQELIGNSPEEKPREALRWIQCKLFKRCNLARYTSFVEKDQTTRNFILEAPELKRASIANESAIPLKYWRKISSEANGKVFIYLNPINPQVEMGNSNYLINAQMTGEIVKKTGAGFADLAFTVSELNASDFTDASHTNSNGNQKIAKVLKEEIVEKYPELNQSKMEVLKTP